MRGVAAQPMAFEPQTHTMGTLVLEDDTLFVQTEVGKVSVAKILDPVLEPNIGVTDITQIGTREANAARFVRAWNALGPLLCWANMVVDWEVHRHNSAKKLEFRTRYSLSITEVPRVDAFIVERLNLALLEVRKTL